ncbi:MAG: PQQ-binding-like beta-propeller repeat protein [Candidatus Brocadiae bacterium]|nr:PQQ-binding-like beta-propeller repeat protein [Candidatus Brocadiia bacterium]
MKIVLRKCCWRMLLLAPLILASCAAPAPASKPISKLSPENALFDLEQEGLKLLWRQELGKRTDAPLRDIYCTGNIVVVEAEGGELHCLKSSDGTWKATRLLGDRLTRAPKAQGQRLYLVIKNNLYIFDTASGGLSGAYRPGFAIFTPPQVYGDSLILAGGNGHLRRMMLDAPRKGWLTSLEGPILEEPVIAEDRVFAAACYDKVIAVQAEDGLVLWKWKPREPSRISSGVAVLGHRLFVGDDRGFIYSLRADYGEPTWKMMAGASIVGRPRVVGTDVLVFTARPSLISIAAGGDMQTLWECEGATELVAAGETTAYVLTEDHSVVALCLETGKEMWRHPLPVDCEITGDPTRAAFYIVNSKGSIVALGELD